MLRSFVFHLDGELHDQTRVGRAAQDLRKLWAGERIAVIVRMEPNARHVVHLAAAPQVFLPVWQLRIDGPERNQQSGAMLLAIGGQPRIDAANVPVQDAIETAGPRL